MQVVDAKVDWMLDFHNEPNIRVLLSDIPQQEDLRYNVKGSAYYAEKDGYVSFYSYRSPGRGYGGRRFPITLVDGSEKILEGPWSSNSGHMNSCGFGPCKEISYTTEREVMERGYTFYAGSVTVEFARVAAKKAGVHLAEVRQQEWGISLHPDYGIKPILRYVKEADGYLFNFLLFGDYGRPRKDDPARYLSSECSQEQSAVVGAHGSKELTLEQYKELGHLRPELALETMEKLKLEDELKTKLDKKNEAGRKKQQSQLWNTVQRETV